MHYGIMLFPCNTLVSAQHHACFCIPSPSFQRVLMRPQTNPICRLQILQDLNSPELTIAVLIETGKSLSYLVAAIPAAFHSAAVHATFPTISLQASLALDVGAGTTAAATAALEVFAAASAPRSLQLSNFLLNPAPACEALQDGSLAAQQSVAGTSTSHQAASSTAMPASLQRFVTALRRALRCSSLEDLCLSNITFVGQDLAQDVLGGFPLSPQLHRLQFLSVSCIDASFLGAVHVFPSPSSLEACIAVQSLHIGWCASPPPATHDHQLYSFAWPHFFDSLSCSHLNWRHQPTLLEGWLGTNTQLTELCLTNVPSQQLGSPLAALLSVLLGLKSLTLKASSMETALLAADSEAHLPLQRLTALTRLQIHAHERLEGAPALNVLSTLHTPSLKKLNLRSWTLGNEAMIELSVMLRLRLTCLESLTVDVSGLNLATITMLDAVGGLSTCTELDLYSVGMNASGFTDVAFADMVGRLHHMQRLTLTHFNLVEHLDIVYPHLAAHASDTAKHTQPLLSSLSQLSSLELSASFDRDIEGTNVLAGLSRLSKLRSLKICGSLLLDDSMKNLSDGLSHLSNLESLTLQALECSAAGAAFFWECLPELVSLKYLALVCTFSYEQDIGMAVACTNLSRVSRLACLVLDKNLLGPEVSQVLSDVLPMLSDLECVSMYQCGFLFDGLGVLTGGLSVLTRLERLCLTATEGSVGDVSLIATALAEMTNLRKLSLGKCMLSDAGVAELTRAFSRMPKLSDVDFWAADTSSDGLTNIGWGHVGEWLQANTSIRRCNLCKYEDLIGSAAAQVFLALSDDDPLRLSELAAAYRVAHCRV